MDAPLLEMRNICKSFPGVQALSDVSITLHKGEVIGLLGENGAGKSTLIKILAGAYKRSSGEIIINGDNVDFVTSADAKQFGLQVIYQELMTLETMSVAENICVGNLPKTKLGLVDWKKMLKTAREALTLMDVSSINPRSILGELLIHEKQIVEIAKAINQKASILVMDEPTAALGEDDAESLFKVIRQLKDKGVGIIYISHHLEEIFKVTDKIVVLRDGNKVAELDTDETDKDTLITHMVGREMDSFYADKKAEIKEVILKANKLTIDSIIEDISFELHRGEVLGLFGLLGSGRLNIARALYGLAPIDSGSIEINGKTIYLTDPQKAIKNKIGFLPVDRKLEGLALPLDIAANVTMANIEAIGTGLLLNKRVENQKTDRWKKEINIKAPSISTIVNNFSGGNQQKIVIAKLLETGSEVFIMNEPTRGIDVGAKAEIYELMERLCQSGAAIIMISTDMPEMLSMSDRILVIAEGKINAEFTSKEATQKKLLQAAIV